MTDIRPAVPADAAAVRRLLAALELPLEGVEAWLPQFVVAEADGGIAGLAGLEVYQDGALLRSVAVAPSQRGSGLGSRLVEDALARAARAGIRDVYLLTTTAEKYFPKFGFGVIPRAEVPGSVQESVEFRSACPASAVVMHKSLGTG